MLDEQAPRRVVPRWRNSRLTGRTPEAKSVKGGKTVDAKDEIASARADFLERPTVPHASELMFIAEQAGDSQLAAEAAKIIIDQSPKIGSMTLVKAAHRVLDGTDSGNDSVNRTGFIREARKILSNDFNNPVLLIDIAHAMTANGRAASAERFVRAAVALAPNNRFVVRSAARYFLHVDKKDIAHKILLRSPLLKGDPWVQASEIAIATVLGKNSKNLKLLDSSLQAMTAVGPQFTELSSAVATVHFNDGSDKRAKRLFQKSLTNANDNSVAQAEWAARRLGLAVPEVALQVPLSFEANSAHSYRELDLETSIVQARQWSQDEPFSSRPLHWLGYLFAINEDFSQAAEFHQMVVSREKNPPINDLLNLNFSRIETGAIDQAALDLVELSRRDDAAEHVTQILANFGALSYATGDVETAREMYRRAANAARSRGDMSAEGLARAFFARAAVKYADDARDEIVQEATEFGGLSLSPGATYVVKRLVDKELREKLEQAAAKKVARQKLVWDPKTNTLHLGS